MTSLECNAGKHLKTLTQFEVNDFISVRLVCADDIVHVTPKPDLEENNRLI